MKNFASGFVGFALLIGCKDCRRFTSAARELSWIGGEASERRVHNRDARKLTICSDGSTRPESTSKIFTFLLIVRSVAIGVSLPMIHPIVTLSHLVDFTSLLLAVRFKRFGWIQRRSAAVSRNNGYCWSLVAAAQNVNFLAEGMIGFRINSQPNQALLAKNFALEP
jgi:hypothetical protein